MLTRIDKAITAGVTAGIAAGLTAQQGGRSLTEVAEIVIGTVIVVGFLTWLVPNKPAAA